MSKVNLGKFEENKLLEKERDRIQINLEELVKSLDKMENTVINQDLTKIQNNIKEDKSNDNISDEYILNTVSSLGNGYNITSLSSWDDIVAVGLWFALFIIFGPTAIVVLIVYICCKNVVLRNNTSALLG